MLSIVRLLLLCALLALASVLKLVPGGTPGGLMQIHPLVGRVVAILELCVAAGLLWKRTRRVAACIATAFFLTGCIYMAMGPPLRLPPCGCFGGRVDISWYWHLLINGMAIFLLADLVHPTWRAAA